MREAVHTARQVIDVARDREITFLAASISYYALVSLLPLLMLAVVVGSLVGGPAFASLVGDLVAVSLPVGEQFVAEALADRTGQSGLGVVSLALTVWGALKVFRGVDLAFDRVYGAETASLVQQVKDAAVTLASVGAGMAGVAVFEAVVLSIDLPFVGLVGTVLLLVAVFVAFLPLYYFLPAVDTTVREVAPGAAVAAVGWTGLGVAFGVYTDLVGASAFGALGALLLLVTWFYVSAILLLLGAIVNAVTGDRLAGDPSATTGSYNTAENDDTPR